MKILCIGDLHFGEQNNSPKFNQQVNEFLEWACNLAEEMGVERVVQFGDWYHQRDRIDVSTMNYSIEGAKLLGSRFGTGNAIVFLGNHDIRNRDRLDIHSLKTIDPYVTVITEPTIYEDMNAYIVPWIVNDEQWDDVVAKSKEVPFLFAHLELNGFMVNDAYEMQHGFSPTGLRDYEIVLSGHYHSPQRKKNVQYLGTPYPITMNEANEAHGVYVFDTDTGELEFIEYHGVKVISVPYANLENIIDTLDPTNTTIRVEFPDELEDESVIEDVQNILAEMNFSNYKVKYRGQKAKQLLDLEHEVDVEEVENIDESVLQFIANTSEVPGIDKERLKKWYTNAINYEEESYA